MSIKIGDLVHVPVDGTMGRYVPTIGLVLDIEKDYFQYSINGDRVLVELYFPHTILYFSISKLRPVVES